MLGYENILFIFGEINLQAKQMITLTKQVADEIRREMESIPEKYQKPFNSGHEGYAVLLEEVEELKDEIFFGEKKHKKIVQWSMNVDPTKVGKPSVSDEDAAMAHRAAIRNEAIQVAAMACRIVQELT